MPSGRATAVLVALAAGALGGCGADEVRHEIDDVRIVRDPSPPAPVGATAAQRFDAGHGADGLPSPGSRAQSWAFATPPGWRELPPAPMRDHAWRAGAEGTECTFVVLDGAAGGLLANVNRWRQQMSLPPADESAVAALPTSPWLGAQARRVELDGTYVGMRSSPPVPGARLLGLVAPAAEGTAFLKLVGPAGAVEAERARFLELAASLRPSAAPAPHGARGLSVPSTGARPLAWTAPASWREQPPRSMRVVTFVPDGAGATSVYVTVLAGRAGGLAANVERWYREMALPPPSADAIAALPRGPVLGGEGVYVEIEGTFSGTGASPTSGAALLGMVRERDRGSVFVKMVGPAAEVRGERDRFRAFCESLRD